MSGVRPRLSFLGLKSGQAVLVWLLLMLSLLVGAGCAKYNTYYNAKKSFDDAEHVRQEAIRNHEDPPEPSGAQKTNYLEAIKKAQKVLDEYPGHSLTDDSLFLQAKAHSRLSSYRQSIAKLDLLFLNYPATEYEEEALYLQGLNYLMIGAVDRSQEFLDQLANQYPESKIQSETLKVSGDNSFILEKWDDAIVSYEKYLEEFSDDLEADRIGLKLAECYWEVEEFLAASEVLQIVDQNSNSAEIGFKSRLLRARVHVRLNDFEVTEFLLAELVEEAEIYSSQGDVVLIEAESLVAQGRGDEASPLIEGMPMDWNTPTIKSRAADILGYLYLQRGDLEAAGTQFAIAIRGRDDLDDYNRTRILDQNLKDYLAAETALPDAQPERVPRLKLLQANALLFGFERPSEAGLLFREAGLDSAADSLMAPRGLYGAVVVYRDYLDNPDSAMFFADLLEERYPESPQAFELRSQGEGNLLGYLLAQKDSTQAVYLASLSPEELAELQKSTVSSGGARAGRGRVLEGVRRRMVYLSRRDNLLYDPPEGAAEAAEAKAQADREKRAADAAEIQSMDEQLKSEGVLGQDMPDSNRTPDSEFLIGPQDDGSGVSPENPDPEEIKKKAEEEEKEEEDDDDGGFDIR
ncbi:MAG: tetratricopeptide repeat protein [bacterium]|nr:tetratricopeptide repeat protein [bacterium]